MIATTQLVIRHYQPGDIVTHLMPEYSYVTPTPELCWVAEDSEGAIQASILVAAGHQIVVFLRVAALPGAPRHWLLAMLRSIQRELAGNGYQLAVACVSAARVEELKLGRILERMGGKLEAMSGYAGVIPVAWAGRW